MHLERNVASQKSRKLIRELVRLNTSGISEQKASFPEQFFHFVLPGGFIALGSMMGVGMLMSGLSNYPAAVNFKHKAVSATGLITNTERQSRTVGGAPVPQTYTALVSTIQFETKQGEVIQFKADNVCRQSAANPERCNGKAIQVLYASDNPQLTMIEEGYSPLDNARTQIVWGMIYLSLGTVLFILLLFSATEYGGQSRVTRQI